MILLATRVATKGRHKIYRHGAVLCRGGKVIAKACNRDVAHAEERVLAKAGPDNCIGATLYVARLGYQMSKPCPKCELAIAKAGIKKVVYTDWDCSIQIERI